MYKVKTKAEVWSLGQSGHLHQNQTYWVWISQGQRPHLGLGPALGPGKEWTGEVVGMVELWATRQQASSLSPPLYPFPWCITCREGGFMSEDTERPIDLCKSNFKLWAKFTHFLWLPSLLLDWMIPTPSLCNFNTKDDFYQVFLCNQDIKIIPTFLFENGSSETQ